MNNIIELIEIIKLLGGSATTEQICYAYLKQHKMIIDSSYLNVIENTLKNNADILFKKDGKWQLVLSNTKNSATKVNKSSINSIENLNNMLKGIDELNPYEYDACYELMRDTINEYKKINSFENVNVSDMNFIYSLCVGTWKMSIEVRKERLELTHLSKESKEKIHKIIDYTWERAKKKEYTHHSRKEDPQIGMFGTGFMTFSGKLSDEDSRKFIIMCTQILDLNDEKEIYDICSNTLNDKFEGKGLKAGSASMILHCLKPYVFPIMNANYGHSTIYESLGIVLNKPKELKTYINNCRAITEYRNRNYRFKNYRLLDRAKWILDGDYDSLQDILIDL